jgi:hypothetical protein
MSMDAEPSLAQLWDALKSALKSAPLRFTQVADRMSAVVDDIDDQQYTVDELYEAFVKPVREELDLLEDRFARLQVRLIYAECDAAARRSQLKVIGNNQA